MARLTRKEKSTLTPHDILIHFWRKNPDIAVYDLFAIELTWLQRITVRNAFKSKFNMILWSRGLGKTFLGAVIFVLAAILYPGLRLGIFAPAFRQAEDIIDYIEEMVINSDILKNCIIYTSSKKPVHRSQYKAEMKFKNGSLIRALPLSDGKKVRGKRYNWIWLEEYAQIDEMVIKLAVNPMLNIKTRGRDNKFFYSSTAYYSFNHYYKQYLYFNLELMRGNFKYNLSEFTYLDHLMISDPPYEYDLDVLERQKNDPTITSDEFSMENLCKFPIDNQGMFSARLIDNCVPKKKPLEVELKSVEDPRYFYAVGVDVARQAGCDNFAIVVLKVDRLTYDREIVYCAALNGATYPKMTMAVREIIANFEPVERVWMDMKGGGSSLKDLLAYQHIDKTCNLIYPAILDMDDDNHKKINGKHILRMFPSSQQAVNKMWTTLKASMEKGQVLFPIDRLRYGDRDMDIVAMEVIRIKRELYMLVAEPLGEYFRYTVPKGHKKDRAFALALANMAALDSISCARIEGNQELGVGFWVPGE